MMEEKIFIKKRNKIKRVKTKKHNLGDIKTNKKTFQLKNLIVTKILIIKLIIIIKNNQNNNKNKNISNN